MKKKTFFNALEAGKLWFLKTVFLVFGTILISAQTISKTELEGSGGYMIGVLNPETNLATSELVTVGEMPPTPYAGMQFIWLPVRFSNNDDDSSQTFNSLSVDGIVYADFYLLPGVVSSYSKLPEISNYPIAAMTGLVNAEDSLGELVFVHGNGVGGGIWQSTGSYVELDDGFVSEQMWYVYKLDYASHLYDFFLNGVLIAENVPFIDSSVIQFDQIEAETNDEEEVYFDRLTISHVEPAGLSQKSDTEVAKKSGGKKRTASLPTANFRVSESVSGDEEIFIAPLAASESSEVDTDEDGMTDEEELANGLDPEVDDAMLDYDGDGYPNIYELSDNGGNPSDRLIIPRATYVVTKNALVEDNKTRKTIKGAIDAVTDDYSIILVEAGIYKGEDNLNFSINSNDSKMLLISKKGPANTILDGENERRGGGIYKDGSALVGFTIRNCKTGLPGAGLYISGYKTLVANCKIYNNYSSSNGGGLYLSNSTTLVRSCEVYDNTSNYNGGGIFIGSCDTIQNTLIYRNYAKSKGGGIYCNYPSGEKIEHTTLYNNKAASGSDLYRVGSPATNLILTNSIIWNETETDVLGGNEVAATYSIIKETSGYIESTTVSNENPNLTVRGLLTKGSIAAINDGIDIDVDTDIHGESRPYGSRPDIGADEWVDRDRDGLPDWLEYLGVTIKEDDNDEDKLNNISEYRNGTDPLESDTDNDGLEDGREVNEIGSDPLSSDTDGDSILDKEEVDNGLNSNADDAMLDYDGDGYPNIYELRGNGGNPSDRLITPRATYIVTKNALVEDHKTRKTIKGAIDAVTDDYSIILVRSGIYTGEGNPDFEIKSHDPKMLIISSKGAADTILDGEGIRRGGQIKGNKSALVGFSIRNCEGAPYGGGLSVTGNQSLIASNIFYDNKASNYGGGIYCSTGQNIIISDCAIYNNEAIKHGGGGIWALSSNNLLVDRCRIYNNMAGSHGGGLYMDRCLDSVVQNTLVFRNQANANGGGIYSDYLASGGLLKLVHTTLYNNEASYGSELYRSRGSLALTNSIVWNDTETGVLGGNSINATCSIIKETSGYVDNGKVSNENPNLGFQGQLTKASHYAINNGTDANVTTDIHGEVRPNGNGYDIGADEWVDSDDDGLPDWLEALSVTEPLEDNDDDGLKNRFEYKNGLDPEAEDSDKDGLDDGIELNQYNTDPLDPDTDGDEMLDGEEIENSLDPLVNDAMLDLDGDRYPNIYELRGMNGDPNNATVKPSATYIVEKRIPSENYNELQSAIEAVDQNYSIILVKEGIYTGENNPSFTIDSDNPAMLIISESGAENTIFDGEEINSGANIKNVRSALVGLTIRNCIGTSDGAGLNIAGGEAFVANCTFYNNETNKNGGGVYVGSDLVSLKDCAVYSNNVSGAGGGLYFNGNSTRLVGCNVYDNKSNGRGGGIYVSANSTASTIESSSISRNESGSDAGGIRLYNVSDIRIENTSIYLNSAFLQGGGIHFSGVSDIKLVHTTLHNNAAVESGNEIYKNGGNAEDIILTNSIVWNDTETNVFGGNDVTVSCGVVRGTSGYFKANNEDYLSNENPNLGFQSMATKASNRAINDGKDIGVTVDIHGEDRPNGSGYDIGADEWVDSDDDGLPDWLEALGVTTRTGDTDDDELNNIFEFRNGTDPRERDTDGDTLTDGQEIRITGTNPIVPDDVYSLDADFNFDGLDDSIGIQMGITIDQIDSDGDSVSNLDEISQDTNPLQADTDGDGVNDNDDAFPLDPDLAALPTDINDSDPPALILIAPPEAILSQP